MLPEKKTNTLGEVFVAQPDSIKERLAGKLFLLIETESGDTSYLKLMNFLISELARNYYQSEKMILRERMPTVKIDHIFEAALAKTNRGLANFLEAEKIILKPELLSATAGVIFENELHFSALGKNKAFLIYASKPDTGYKITEVGKAAAEKREPGSNKLFSAVISGSIPAGGYFLFANEALPEYLSSRQLTDIISTLPPASAAGQMKNLLEQINAYIPFMAIIVKNTGGSPFAEEIAQEAPLKDSIYDLYTTEEKTEKLLTPAGIIDLSGWLDKILSKIRLPRFSNLSSTGGLPLLDKLFFKKRPSFKSIKDAGAGLFHLLAVAMRFFAYLMKLLFDPKNYRATLVNISSALKNSGARLGGWFKALKVRQKAMLIIALAAIFLFFQNSLVLNLKNKSLEEEKRSLNLLTAINQKEDQIEAALIYRNEAGAKALLSEVGSMLEALPLVTAEQKTEYERLEKRYREYLEKIKHAVKVDKLAVLADLGPLAGSAKPGNLHFAEGQIFAAGAAGTIFYYDLKTKTASSSALTAETAELEFPAFASPNLYYLAGDHLWQVEAKTKKAVRLTLAGAGGSDGISGIYPYNSRLYVLNSRDSQIYRLNRVGTGFGEAGAWLKEPADLADAKHVFIDGNIYVLKGSGEILKFLRGERENFPLDKAEPPVTDAKKFIITGKQKFVYLLEPAKKRLLVYDKTGKLVVQYELALSGELVDFALNEEAKKIYWLLDGKIMEGAGQYF